MRLPAQHVSVFQESMIREMTRRAHQVGAINLAQEFPDFGPPRELLEAAQRALADGYNQYAITGEPPSSAPRSRTSWSAPQGSDPERHLTVTCGATEAMSKTSSVTGWRVGWAAVLDDALSGAIRKAHDFRTVGAASPLQQAGVVALRFPDRSYWDMVQSYQRKRDLLLGTLQEAGFRPTVPGGAYDIMADFTAPSEEGDVRLALRLVEEVGVAAVPGSSFFHEPSLGRRYVRFAYPKREQTLEEAARPLARLEARR